jgi:hypothetical protein
MALLDLSWRERRLARPQRPEDILGEIDCDKGRSLGYGQEQLGGLSLKTLQARSAQAPDNMLITVQDAGTGMWPISTRWIGRWPSNIVA